jgi:hypothetical protein
MNTRQACEVIWSIEQELNVNEPKVLGVHLWPFMALERKITAKRENFSGTTKMGKYKLVVDSS